MLLEQRYAVAVRDAQQRWLDQGVHAVPHFLFNGRYQVSCAQEAETFVRVIDKVAALDPACRATGESRLRRIGGSMYQEQGIPGRRNPANQPPSATNSDPVL